MGKEWPKVTKMTGIDKCILLFVNFSISFDFFQIYFFPLTVQNRTESVSDCEQLCDSAECLSIAV